jgi:PAS domain S-box-containing protein
MAPDNHCSVLDSEDFLRQALQDYAVVTLDSSGKIVQWSDGAERIFGWPASEVVDRSFNLLFTPEDQAADKPGEELGRAARGEASPDERWHMRKDGTRIFISGIVRALRDESGKLISFSKIARDITGQKLAEMQREALLAREQAAPEQAESRWRYLEEIFESLPAAVGLVRLPEQAYVFANRMLREVLGNGSLIGDQLRNVGVVLNAEDFSMLDTPAATGRTYSAKERRVTMQTAEGSEQKYFDFFYHPMRSAAGSYEAILVFGVDVTDRVEHRRMEQRLQEADKWESVGVLAGGIAHDFNNLLTGIIGNISLAMDLTEPDSRIRGLLATASQASERAALLTKQMLAYAGKGQCLVQPVNLSAVVRETMKLIGASVPGNVHLEMLLTDDLPPLHADETQLQQVAMNLILNAAEATDDRGGRVIVRTGIQEIDSADAAKPCSVGRLSPGRYVVLEVQDTGIGIDPSIKPHLFDPFFTTKFAGRGLGLASVSGIVRVLKGAVLVDSAPGQGSTFRVMFPIAPVSGKSDLPQRQEEPYPIVVVDDEEVVRRTAELMLRNQGYQVVVAENGQQALDLFRKLECRVKLVLLDMTMPEMSGEETFRHLKGICGNVPVIVCSGYAEADAIQSFGGLGVAGFIQKPYTPQTLIEKVQDVIKPI